MKKALLSIALAVCGIAFADTYNTVLHARISPTNHVVTSIPTWAQSATPPKSGADTNEVNALIAKYDETNLTARIDAKVDANDATNISESVINKYDETNLTTRINAKQDTLVSGTNIKTVNNQSLLGSGNIEIQGGSSISTNDIESISSTQITNSVQSGYLCTVATAQAKADAAAEIAKAASVPNEHNGNFIKWDENNNLNIMANIVFGDAGTPFISEGGDFTITEIGVPTHKLSLKADATNVYTKSEIDGTSVTNIGAVVAATNAAMTYADGNFVRYSLNEPNKEISDQYEITVPWSFAGGLYSFVAFDNDENFGINFVGSGAMIKNSTGNFIDFYDDEHNRSRLTIDGSSVATSKIATNAAEAVVGEVLDYALTNLTGASVSLSSGQIGNATLTADTTVTLDFSAAANRSGDCLLYIVNNDPTNDFDIIPTQTNGYHFVSADLEKALTIGKATTNIVSFTRLKSDTVLVSKVEVK